MGITGATARAHQPLPPENDKTIIRRAIEIDPEANAKLRKINNADEVGDAPELVPEPDSRCRATVLPKNWSYWFFIGHGQKRCAPQAEVLLSLVRSTRSRTQSRGDSGSDGVPRVVLSSLRGAGARVRRARPEIGRLLDTPASNEP